jgi:hypothetical protein
MIEFSLHGRKFTWSNKQNPPLLERLDWFFTSNSWTLAYSNCDNPIRDNSVLSPEPLHLVIKRQYRIILLSVAGFTPGKSLGNTEMIERMHKTPAKESPECLTV